MTRWVLAAALCFAGPVLAQSDVDMTIREVGRLLQTDRNDEAVDRLQALAADVTGAEQAKVGNALGYTLYSAGRLDEASKTLEEARDVARAEGDRATLIKTLNNLGLVEFARENLGAARESFEEAAALGSDYAREYLDIIDRQERAPAVGELTNAGVSAFYKGDHDAALESYSAALEIDPNNSRVLNLRGYVLLRQGDIDAAERDLARAVELDPTALIPRLNLLKVRCAAGSEALPPDLAPRNEDEAETYAGDGELARLCGDRLGQLM